MSRQISQDFIAQQSRQRQNDIRRLQEIIASGRKVPNEDDIIFIRALMNPENSRLPNNVRDQLRPLIERWL